jgi:hypothetical protein
MRVLLLGCYPFIAPFLACKTNGEPDGQGIAAIAGWRIGVEYRLSIAIDRTPIQADERYALGTGCG